MSGHLFPQFLDGKRLNDVVTQLYNPSGDPTGAGLGRGKLGTAQTTPRSFLQEPRVEFTLGRSGTTTPNIEPGE
jgi:hypothetical protein